jgi:hypothetical protein
MSYRVSCTFYYPLSSHTFHPCLGRTLDNLKFVCPISLPQLGCLHNKGFSGKSELVCIVENDLVIKRRNIVVSLK